MLLLLLVVFGIVAAECLLGLCSLLLLLFNFGGDEDEDDDDKGLFMGNITADGCDKEEESGCGCGGSCW